MEKKHKTHLMTTRFPEACKYTTKVAILEIDDNYQYGDEVLELIGLLKQALESYLA